VTGVSAILIRRQIIRRRRHLTAVVAVLALGAAVATHHDAMAIGGMPDHHGMTVAMEICLGVMTAVGAGVAAVACGVLSVGRLRPTGLLIVGGPVIQARPPLPRARAGPPLLCLLCVSRR